MPSSTSSLRSFSRSESIQPTHSTYILIMVSLARPPSVRTAEVSCYTTRRRCAGIIGEYPDAGQMIGNTRRTRQKESGEFWQHSQQNPPPSLHRTLRRLWTHLPQLSIWPRPPPRHDPPPRSSPGQPCPQTLFNNPPRPHWPLASSPPPRSLGKRTNHAPSSDIHTLPPPQGSLPPAVWPPHHESTRSLASKFIPQHCPRGSSRSQDRRSAPATGRSTPPGRILSKGGLSKQRK